MYEKPEFPPLLGEGFHAFSLDQLQDLCVNRFPLSSTRPVLMQGLREVLGRITAVGVPFAVWIDGSFLTENIDPRDVDLVLWYPAHFYDSGTPEQQAAIDWLTSNDNEPMRLHRCDTHAEPVYPEGHSFHHMVADARQFWLDFYGHSVEKKDAKGIAVVEIGAQS